jgi:hypothetical protein
MRPYTKTLKTKAHHYEYANRAWTSPASAAQSAKPGEKIMNTGGYHRIDVQILDVKDVPDSPQFFCTSSREGILRRGTAEGFHEANKLSIGIEN